MLTDGLDRASVGSVRLERDLEWEAGALLLTKCGAGPSGRRQ